MLLLVTIRPFKDEPGTQNGDIRNIWTNWYENKKDNVEDFRIN